MPEPDELAELVGSIEVPNAPDGPEPCFACECCAIWTESLQLLRDSIQRHVAGELRIAPCDPECLVCGSVDWQNP